MKNVRLLRESRYKNSPQRSHYTLADPHIYIQLYYMICQESVWFLFLHLKVGEKFFFFLNSILQFSFIFLINECMKSVMDRLYYIVCVCACELWQKWEKIILYSLLDVCKKLFITSCCICEIFWLREYFHTAEFEASSQWQLWFFFFSSKRCAGICGM